LNNILICTFAYFFFYLLFLAQESAKNDNNKPKPQGKAKPKQFLSFNVDLVEVVKSSISYAKLNFACLQKRKLPDF